MDNQLIFFLFCYFFLMPIYPVFFWKEGKNGHFFYLFCART